MPRLPTRYTQVSPTHSTKEVRDTRATTKLVAMAFPILALLARGQQYVLVWAFLVAMAHFLRHIVSNVMLGDLRCNFDPRHLLWRVGLLHSCFWLMSSLWAGLEVVRADRRGSIASLFT
eukprot:SAG31_NODE_4915_length_2870_cov_8.711913_2_plen_119_part_00